jgi:putative addiction module antidote
MMIPLKICKVGDSLGIALPDEVLQKLQLGEGDRMLMTETDDGLYLTIGESEELDLGMAAYRKFAKKYRHALNELAK